MSSYSSGYHNWFRLVLSGTPSDFNYRGVPIKFTIRRGVHHDLASPGTMPIVAQGTATSINAKAPFIDLTPYAQPGMTGTPKYDFLRDTLAFVAVDSACLLYVEVSTAGGNYPTAYGPLRYRYDYNVLFEGAALGTGDVPTNLNRPLTDLVDWQPITYSAAPALSVESSIAFEGYSDGVLAYTDTPTPLNQLPGSDEILHAIDWDVIRNTLLFSGKDASLASFQVSTWPNRDAALLSYRLLSNSCDYDYVILYENAYGGIDSIPVKGVSLRNWSASRRKMNLTNRNDDPSSTIGGDMIIDESISRGMSVITAPVFEDAGPNIHHLMFSPRAWLIFRPYRNDNGVLTMDDPRRVIIDTGSFSEWRREDGQTSELEFSITDANKLLRK